MKENKTCHEGTEQTTTNRRGFLKKSVVITAPIVVSVTTPIVVTAASSPIYDLRCGLSGMQSGFQSIRPNQELCAQGNSPGGWGTRLARQGKWPFGYGGTVISGRDCKRYATFEACIAEIQNHGGVVYDNASCGDGANIVGWWGFPKFSNYFSGSPYGDDDLMEILHYRSGSEEFHFVAALLNAARGEDYPLSVADVKSLWNNVPAWILEDYGTINAFFESTYGRD